MPPRGGNKFARRIVVIVVIVIVVVIAVKVRIIHDDTAILSKVVALRRAIHR